MPWAQRKKPTAKIKTKLKKFARWNLPPDSKFYIFAAAVEKLKIEYFAVRDRKTHGKMLSVRPRRQICRTRGTKPLGCRGYLFAVRFDSRVPCVVFLPCVSLKYVVCSCVAVCLIYICRELLICRGLSGLAHGIVCYAVRRPTTPEWRTTTPDFPVVTVCIQLKLQMVRNFK
jgi:hypothetical protein